MIVFWMHLEGSTWVEACNRDEHVSSGNQAFVYLTLWTEKILTEESCSCFCLSFSKTLSVQF